MKGIDIKFGRNLFLALVGIVTTVGVLTIVTFTQLGSSNKSMQALHDMQVNVLEELKELRTSISIDRQDVMAMVLDQDRSQQAPRIRALEARRKSADVSFERLSTYLSPYPSLHRELGLLLAERNAFVETRDQLLVPLILAGRMQEAQEIVLGVQAQRILKMSEAQESLTSHFNALVQQRLAEVNDSGGDMLRLIAALNGIGLALCAAILAFMRRTISELEEAETGLNFRNTILNAQQEASPDDIIVVDPSGTIIFHNGRYPDLWGPPAEAATKRPFLELMASLQSRLANGEGLMGRVTELLQDPRARSRDELLLSDGRVFDRFTAPLEDSEGNSFGRIWYLRDITDQRHIERELLNNWRLFQSVLDNAAAVIFVKDLAGGYLMVNRRYEELFHVSRGWIIGKTDYDVFPRDLAEAYRSFDRKVVAAGKALEAEEVAQQDEGMHTYLSTKAPLFDEKGHVYAICGVSTDITELKRAEKEHLAHVRFLESLELVDRAIRGAESLDAMLMGGLDAALDIFASDRAWLLYPCDPDVSAWNVPMERTRSEFPGAMAMGVDLPMTPEVKEAFSTALATEDAVVYDSRSGRPLPDVTRQFQVQSQIQVAIYPKRGRPWLFGMHQCSHPRVWEDQDVLLFKEISRRIADGLSSLLFLRELQESREQLRSTLASMDDLVFVLDREGRLVDYFHPPEQPGPHGPAAVLISRTFPESLPPESAEPLQAAVDRVMHLGTVQQVEYPVANGGKQLWYSAKASARRSAAGAFAGVTIVARDVTQAKETEEFLRHFSEELEQRVWERTSELEGANAELTQLAARLENAYNSLRVETAERLKVLEELREKDRMLIQQSHLATMGEVMDCIAHHWRQPLNVLGLIVQELSMQYGTLPAQYVTENAAKGMHMIRELSTTIDDFSYFFRSDEEKGAFRLKDVVAKAVALVEVGLSGLNLQLELVIEDSELVVEGYRRDFFQVLLNILSNAKESCSNSKVPEPRIVVRQFSLDGEAVITVADNAGNVTEEALTRAFEPYFIIRGPDKGGGIGLYMAKVIIEKNMHGKLTLRNTGEGAEFRIEIGSATPRPPVENI